MGKMFFMALVGMSAGVTIGSAAAAFFTLLKFIPRLVQITESHDHIKLFESVITLGATVSSLLYFSHFTFRWNRLSCIPIGLAMGIFLGLFTSALAEVLNVIPVFSKKFKIKHELKFIIIALIFGKLAGALYYWLFYIKI